MFQRAVDEAGEGGVVPDAEADEGFGVAAWFEGADGVNDFSGGDAFAAEAKKDEDREEYTRDEGGNQRKNDKDQDKGGYSESS